MVLGSPWMARSETWHGLALRSSARGPADAGLVKDDDDDDDDDVGGDEGDDAGGGTSTFLFVR